MSWICPSYFFFPLAGGYILEENFRRFVSTHASLTIWVFIFCFVLSAALTCFVYRHNAAAQINQVKSWKIPIMKFLAKWRSGSFVGYQSHDQGSSPHCDKNFCFIVFLCFEDLELRFFSLKAQKTRNFMLKFWKIENLSKKSKILQLKYEIIT